MAKKIRTHYDNLKVARNAPDIVIKAAHKALLQLHHPDKAQDKAAAERIVRILNDAKEVLLDPVKRREHDAWISTQEQSQRQDGTSETGYSPPPHQEPAPRASEEQIGHFRALSNGVALDVNTGLTWCRFALGQTWSEGEVFGEASLYAWQAAQDAARVFNLQGGHAGFNDWRMPSVNELKTLLETGPQQVLRINPLVFPANPNWQWSSSPYAGYGGGAWLVNFFEGLAINDNPSLPCAVRLVRD